MVNEFYVVTLTSLYHVIARGEDSPAPVAEKIALKGESGLPVGHRLKGGTMIAICKFLMPYIPEGCGWLSPNTTFERHVEEMNTFYWGQRTSPIVALFMDKHTALDCLAQDRLVACDPRWLEQTAEVIAAIGDDHPAFEVCHYPDLALMAA